MEQKILGTHGYKIVWSAVIVMVALLTANVIYAQWSAPPEGPPDGNVSSPIHTGAAEQEKLGSLGVLGGMRSPEYCDEDGENCLVPGEGEDFELPGEFTYYLCPYSDEARGDGGSKDCSSTCVGQIGISDQCVDYWRVRNASRDRRCKQRAWHDCVYVSGPPPDSLTFEWEAMSWNDDDVEEVTFTHFWTNEEVTVQFRDVWCIDQDGNEYSDGFCEPSDKPQSCRKAPGQDLRFDDWYYCYWAQN